ncbi:MAG: electron transport complex subunit RsxC [Gammaproteobacteria bacterium]|nr:electron transport complex subunit RsxC [Gammaproteobacteria bacterium]
MKNLFTYPGGVKVDSHKIHDDDTNIRFCNVPERLTLSLSQHIGSPAIPVVNIGDKVLKGQVIADQTGHISARIHAPTSGIIEAIGQYPIPHPSGLTTKCIVIKSDGNDEWLPHKGATNPESLSPYDIRTYVENAGVVGLGGATFPSAVKIDKSPGVRIHTLIINGAECEPYISCDEALMKQRAEEVVLGARLIQKALLAKKCIIALEDDIPIAYERLTEITRHYLDHKVDVVQIPELYPSGGEKQLIQILTGLEVPTKKIPAQIGVSVINVATAASVYRAVYQGEPLISRIITLTGGALKTSTNVEVLLGTPIEHLLHHAGLDEQRLSRLIMGGPMMGFNLPSAQLPTLKATNCILAATEDELAPLEAAMPCIRCGRCADHCPMSLLPQQMYWYSKNHDLKKIQDYNIFDCIECGCCSYVCPSNIPLVQYFRYGKAEVHKDRCQKEKSDKARNRHELREQRLEIIKKEKAEKRKHMAARKKEMAAKKAKEAAEKAADNNPDNSSLESKPENEEDPIKAAMKRVQAKKEAMKKQQ